MVGVSRALDKDRENCHLSIYGPKHLKQTHRVVRIHLSILTVIRIRSLEKGYGILTVERGTIFFRPFLLKWYVKG